jgi:hypothetical protein
VSTSITGITRAGKDPFSSAEFSQRQVEYAKAFDRKDDVYTPQMIVDGQTPFVGNQSKMIVEAIAKAARSTKADVSIATAKSAAKSITLLVRVQNVLGVSNGDTAEVMLALTESGLLSRVSRGENSGHKLAHSAVVRKLTRLGTANGGSFSVERSLDLNSS